MKIYLCIISSLLLALFGCSDDPTHSNSSEASQQLQNQTSADPECVNGLAADQFGCENIDLLAQLSVEDLLTEPLENGAGANDIWGWTDPQTGAEYALVGLNDGVTFVDVSTPTEPVVIGKLNETASVSKAGSTTGFHLQHEGKSSWRDMKVYQNHMYVVSDAQPHGLQVFDLRRLRDVAELPQFFSEDNLYEEFGNAHNIGINEDTGFGYIVGSNTYGGGLHIVDLHQPLSPQLVGFHSDSTVGLDSTGYVHDVQCVVYEGPDTDYQGDEICMNASETHIVIANVNDKQNTQTIAKATNSGNQYAHQGWLTEDHRYYLLDDEFDELHGNEKTRTYIWDVQDLDDPKLTGVYSSSEGAIDHNQYIKGNFVYQANYTAGLRILNTDNIADGVLAEVAYFDTYPNHNERDFDGAWSSYPFFESGIVVVSDASNGLFILKPNL